MSNTHLDRAKILTEALPYIQRYNGKIVVVNCGGVAMDAELRDAVATCSVWWASRWCWSMASAPR